MAEVRKTVLIERSAEQMFRLVDGVEHYPEFLPWCGGSEVIERTDTLTRARIDINYHGVKAHFATANAKVFPHSMTIRLVEGPFKSLDGTWAFTQLGDVACKIEFNLRYEFSSRLIEKVVGPVFSHIANTFVEAFVKQADRIYGKVA
ncbi:MAG: type II toxin-antitoxin system RatA family toxin [Methyloversatilis sp.]|jgi:ribosome-associated toxin RatA of RatAB toxin-antitoxin module|uniref:type II toxin-antitoxin system RatA family toxin n=1 Tax=Methyloversatilis sp. TaxID=2569862 RepID=UPI001A5DBA27|nr:type II toxin-antitoxin system RatA family toxin [Methyloversatilis sp.]MBL8476722.1 type II toxin-antitoxin system RatA family toxin [Methyloversatilis sp.]